jgi:muramoyltetrapeptide carboxypeptidase
MLKPRALRQGDRVAIVAPASSFARDEFDAGIEELRALGFEPVYAASVFDRAEYVAGTAGTRAAALEAAWRDAGIAAVIGARGGYGSVQLLPLLDADLPRRARKPFVGYSDLTSLLVFLTGRCGLVAFHGPMLAARLGKGPSGYDRGSFLRCLTETGPIGELTPPGLEALKGGEAEGLLLGGTLTQLLALLGTPYAFDPPPGHVLFIDEVGERPYRLDRMLTQLRLTGLLARASGLVFGELPRCDEPDGNPRARAVVAELMREFPGPVLFGFPSGHTAGPAWTLPFGLPVRIVTGGSPRLVFAEGAVVERHG